MVITKEVAGLIEAVWAVADECADNAKDAGRMRKEAGDDPYETGWCSGRRSAYLYIEEKLRAALAGSIAVDAPKEPSK